MHRNLLIRKTFVIAILAFSWSALSACSSSKPSKRADNDLIEKTAPASAASEAKAEYDGHVELGHERLEKGEWVLASASYEAALAVDDSDWRIHMNRAIALAYELEFPEAIQAMETAAQKGGDQHHDYYFNLGNLYMNRGLYEESIRAWRAGLAYADDAPIDTLVNISAGYIILQRFDEALETARYIQRLEPNDPRGLHNEALVLQRRKKLEESVAVYERVHQLDPSFAQSYFNKGQALGQMKEYPEAIESLRRFMELSDDRGEVERARQLIKAYQLKMPAT